MEQPHIVYHNNFYTLISPALGGAPYRLGC